MRCRKCGAENLEGSRFCGTCGAPMEEAPRKDPEKRKKKRGWIAAVVIIAAVGVMIAAFLIVRNVREKQEYEKSMDSAEKYLEELDYENAEASYLKAIEIDPKEEKSYVALAKVYLEQGETDKAREVLKTGQENVPSAKADKDTESQGGEDTIPGLLDTIQDMISYSWAVEPTIEADDIYYLTLVDPADCSDNEQCLQKNSPYAVIKIGDRYGMIGMDGQMAAEAEYTEIQNFADTTFLLLKDGDGRQQYGLDEDTGEVELLDGLGGDLNMNGFYYYAANRLRNENETLSFYELQMPEEAIPIQQTQKSKEFCEGAGDPQAWNRELAESKYAVFYQDQLVTDFIFEECGSASDGLLAVKQDGKWGYVNTEGKMVIPAEYDASWPYFSRYNRGNLTLEENVEYCYAFSGGYVPVCRDGQWELKDTEGKSVIPADVFEEIRPVQDGKCWVKKDGKWGVIRLAVYEEEQTREEEKEETPAQGSEDELHQAFLDAAEGVQEIGGCKFLVWENSGGGSGSLSSIFGVRDGEAYEPEISEKYMMFQQEGEQYVGYVSDFSAGYHEYIAHGFAFNTQTGEFQEIQH